MSLLTRNSVMGWRDDAAVAGSIGGAGGFAWLLFRWLVGTVVADAVSDIKVLRSEVEALKASNANKEERLDAIFEALMERRS